MKVKSRKKKRTSKSLEKREENKRDIQEAKQQATAPLYDEEGLPQWLRGLELPAWDERYVDLSQLPTVEEVDEAVAARERDRQNLRGRLIKRGITIEQLVKYYAFGLSDQEVASILGLPRKTWVNWQADLPELRMAREAGRSLLDTQVTTSLLQRARGFTRYQVEDEYEMGIKTKTKVRKERVAPDTKAAIHWLSKRRPDEWGDRISEENTPVDVDESYL